jgi:uncharacterized DUF497 family protein/predicted DNA binding CopG/RHH family protein
MDRVRFEWDEKKNRENQEKHGVSFQVAQYAFADPNRVIAEDLSHSQEERRYSVLERLGKGLSRFASPIAVMSFRSSVQATGEKEGRYMKERIEYTDEPLGDLRVVEDFLPPPEYLAFKEETVKVTIALSKTSVDFFRREARKHHTQYQKMIRRLLDFYVARQLRSKEER